MLTKSLGWRELTRTLEDVTKVVVLERKIRVHVAWPCIETTPKGIYEYGAPLVQLSSRVASVTDSDNNLANQILNNQLPILHQEMPTPHEQITLQFSQVTSSRKRNVRFCLSLASSLLPSSFPLSFCQRYSRTCPKSVPCATASPSPCIIFPNCSVTLICPV